MYVRSVVCRNVLGIVGCHIWKCVSVYTGFGIYPIRSRHATEVLPLPRFYQILSWKKKEKFFIRGLKASNMASLHRDF